MTSTDRTVTINYTVQTGELFDGTWDGGPYDIDASAKKYAAELETRLEAAYPDATVDVRTARTSGGKSVSVMAILPDESANDGDLEERVADHVREIADKLWSGDTAAWVVEAGA